MTVGELKLFSKITARFKFASIIRITNVSPVQQEETLG